MSRRAKDIAGQTFGRLTAISVSHSKTAAFWLCRCACGATTIARGDKLRRGQRKSCGAAACKKGPQAPRTARQLRGFAPAEASAIEAFYAAGKVTVIRQGEWPDELAPGRPRFLDFRRGA